MEASLKISVLQFLKKFQYFIFFSICSVILLSQIYSCLLKYLSVPTYISSYITDQNKVSTDQISQAKINKLGLSCAKLSTVLVSLKLPTDWGCWSWKLGSARA